MENAFCRCGLGYTEGIAPLRREFKETTHKRVPKVSALANATDAQAATGACSLVAWQEREVVGAARGDTSARTPLGGCSGRAPRK